MKGVLVTFIAKVEGVVKEKFSGAPPQTPTFFAPPQIKIPGGATASSTFPGPRIGSHTKFKTILKMTSNVLSRYAQRYNGNEALRGDLIWYK